MSFKSEIRPVSNGYIVDIAREAATTNSDDFQIESKELVDWISGQIDPLTSIWTLTGRWIITDFSMIPIWSVYFSDKVPAMAFYLRWG